MKKFSLTLAFLICLLAPSLYYHSAAHAQEAEEIGDVRERTPEDARQEERERARARERGEDVIEDGAEPAADARAEADQATDDDKAIEELPAAGGCSMVSETASGPNSALFACFWGAAVLTLVLRQRKAG